MNSTVLVHAQDVKKFFGEFPAVNGVSLQIREGECFGLLGPNGAGKSTLINMIYGVVLRGAGELTIFGLDPTTSSRQIKRRLGVVTQDNALDESLTVIENMSIYAAFVEVPKKERIQRVKELLDFMQLAHKANEPIRTLSGGMKRRLVFVRALLSDPDFIILDEPTTGLDPAVRHLLWGKVNELRQRGKTILLTTHYMHEAEVLCDRLAIMNEGKVIAEGTPQGLREMHTPGFVAVFHKNGRADQIQQAAMRHQFQFTEDSSGVYVRAPHLNQLIDFQSEVKIPALQLRPSHLEDVFLKLTGQELTADA